MNKRNSKRRLEQGTDGRWRTSDTLYWATINSSGPIMPLIQSKSMLVSSGKAAGFTLIEIAVAIFVIALLLGSILVPLSNQVEQRQISETQKTLEEIKESIIGFAVAKGCKTADASSSTIILGS